MHCPWMALIMVLLAFETALVAEVTRTEERRVDGSLAAVREVEVLASGETLITHTTYLRRGEARTVCCLSTQGQVLWAKNRLGQKITYTRDDRNRIISVVWDDQTYAVMYDAMGVVSGLSFPDTTVKVAQFRSITWNGLQLTGEVRDTGDRLVLIPDPLIVQGEL
jgi:YD repeat-containing protein